MLHLRSLSFYFYGLLNRLTHFLLVLGRRLLLKNWCRFLKLISRGLWLFCNSRRSILFILEAFVNGREVHAVVDDDGIKLSEWGIDLIAQRIVGGEGNLIPTLDDNRLTRIDIHAFARRYTDNLEGAKSFDFDQLILTQSVVEYIKHQCDKAFSVGFVQFVLLHQHFGQITVRYLAHVVALIVKLPIHKG